MAVPGPQWYQQEVEALTAEKSHLFERLEATRKELKAKELQKGELEDQIAQAYSKMGKYAHEAFGWEKQDDWTYAFSVGKFIEMANEKYETMNRLNGEMLAALIALADRVNVRFGEIIKYEPVATGRYLDAAYEVIGKAKATVKPLSVKERAEKHGIDLSRIEKQPLPPGYSSGCNHEFVNQPLRGGWFCLNCNCQK